MSDSKKNKQAKGCCRRKPEKSIIKGKGVKIPKRITLTDHFSELIQKSDRQNSPAVIDHDGETLIKYIELDFTANKLAKAIRQSLGFWTNNNLDGDIVIAFCLKTNVKALLIMLAIMKLGAAYISIAPSDTSKSVITKISTTRPLLVVVEEDQTIMDKFTLVRHLCGLVTYRELYRYGTRYFDDPNDPVPLECLDPTWKRAACIVYTAGTTGDPRAVRIDHQSVLNRIYWQIKTVPYIAGEISSFSSQLVDAESIGEIFAPLLSFIPIYIMPREVLRDMKVLLDRIHSRKLSRVTISPTILSSLLKLIDEGHLLSIKEKLASLKYLIVCGDVLPYQSGLKYFSYGENNPHLALGVPMLFFYGATETTSEATYDLFTDTKDYLHKCHEEMSSSGTPLFNTTVSIMDSDQNVLPVGTIGEICIQGRSVGMGYSDDREYEHDPRFVRYSNKKLRRVIRMQRLRPKGKVKIFRTGDYGVIFPADGIPLEKRLYYISRTDMNMKVHGMIIEMSTLTKAVTKTEMVSSCAVLCFDRNKENQTAVAFSVMKENRSPEELQQALQKCLKTEYLIPDIFPVKELHHLPSGRLNYQKLLGLYRNSKLECTPEDWALLHLDVHQRQAARILFQSIHDVVGLAYKYIFKHFVDSCFWNLGINSLNTLSILIQIREEGYKLSIDDFVSCNTLLNLVRTMVTSSVRPLSDRVISSVYQSEDSKGKYCVVHLGPEIKGFVIDLLSKSYSQKLPASTLIGVSAQEFEVFVGLLWNFIKDGLSTVTVERNTGRLMGAILVCDVNSRRFKKITKTLKKPLAYVMKIHENCEKIARYSSIGNERGKIIHFFMTGTSPFVTPQENVVIVNFMIRTAIQRARLAGFSSVLIMSSCPLVMDLCHRILLFDIVAEVKLNGFVAKDKTKPFFLADDYITVKAFFRKLS